MDLSLIHWLVKKKLLKHLMSKEIEKLSSFLCACLMGEKTTRRMNKKEVSNIYNSLLIWTTSHGRWSWVVRCLLVHNFFLFFLRNSSASLGSLCRLIFMLCFYVGSSINQYNEFSFFVFTFSWDSSNNNKKTWANNIFSSPSIFSVVRLQPPTSCLIMEKILMWFILIFLTVNVCEVNENSSKKNDEKVALRPLRA